MCELQFIKRYTENLKDEDIKAFIKMLELGSINNKDSFGLMNGETIFKRKGAVNFKGFDLNQLKKQNFVVGHNRNATQGDKNNNYNNHPFNFGEFILMHNGVIQNDDKLKEEYKFKSKIETDSYIILRLIHHFFKESDKKTRQKKIIQAIKNTSEKIKGSFSVFLIDKATNDIYYFKNDNTYFDFILIDKKVLIGSTATFKFNYIYQDVKEMDKEELLIEDNAIYLINDKEMLKKVGEFTPIKEEVRNVYEYKWNKDEDITDYFSGEEVEEEINIIFKSDLGYVPEYKLIGNDKIKFTNKKEFEDILNIFGEIVVIKKKKLIAYVDEFLTLYGEKPINTSYIEY